MSRPSSASEPARLLVWALAGPARVVLAAAGRRVAIGTTPRAASAELPGLVQGLLDAAGLRAPDRIAVAVGPGSFTGIKVSLAFARGLGAGWGIPVTGLDPLAALVLARGGGASVAAVDALRGEAAVRRYAMAEGWPEPAGPLGLEPWDRLSGPVAVDPDMAGPRAGEAPSREQVILAALDLLEAGRECPAEPVWSRPSGAEEAAAKKRKDEP